MVPSSDVCRIAAQAVVKQSLAQTSFTISARTPLPLSVVPPGQSQLSADGRGLVGFVEVHF